MVSNTSPSSRRYNAACQLISSLILSRSTPIHGDTKAPRQVHRITGPAACGLCSSIRCSSTKRVMPRGTRAVHVYARSSKVVQSSIIIIIEGNNLIMRTYARRSSYHLSNVPPSQQSNSLMPVLCRRPRSHLAKGEQPRSRLCALSARFRPGELPPPWFAVRVRSGVRADGGASEGVDEGHVR